LYERGFFSADDEARLHYNGRWTKLSVLWPSHDESTIPVKTPTPLRYSIPAGTSSWNRVCAACLLAVLTAMVSGGTIVILLAILINHRI